MISPTQIKERAEKRYSFFLRSIIAEEKFFPIEFPVGAVPKDYLDLRKETLQLIEKSRQTLGYGYTLESETRRTQRYGLQSLPKRISIDTEQDYLKLLKKEKEVLQFRKSVRLIQATIPELKTWLCQNPLKVVDYSDRWNDLLKVCLYFKQNPKPNLYIRELPIQIHTKFIEQNQGIIRSLLDEILPTEQLNSIQGEKEYTFEKYFSLKYREPLIRIRILDPLVKANYNFPATDISIPVSEFKSLSLGSCNCFITENLMNFLTLPLLKNSFAIFGSGYAVQALKTVSWLSQHSIFYWGDLDLDGFKILSQLRSYFPHVVSIMMDSKTFEAFHEFAVPVVGAIAEVLPHLTEEEHKLYQYLAFHQKRLEQERISQEYVNKFLQNLL